MKDKHAPSELERRLTRELMAKVEGKERFDPTKAILQRHYQSIEESESAIKKIREARDRHITWFARIVVIPFTILICIYLYGIGVDLMHGEVLEASKYSHNRVSIHQAPAMFWFSLTYHAGIVTFLGFITYRCLRVTKWFQ